MSDKITGYNIGETHTTAQHELGTIITNIKTTTYPVLRDYIYVLAAEAITALNFVRGGKTVALAYSAYHTTDVTDGVMGCAHIAIASGSYGWVVYRGVVAGANVATASSAGLTLATTATDGRLAILVNTDTCATVVVALTDAAANAADVMIRGNS